jgi:hypothetical protein
MGGGCVVLSMANNRKVISVVLMFGLLLCSCAEEKLNGLDRSQNIDENQDKEKTFFQDCDGLGFIKGKDNAKHNHKLLHDNLGSGGLCSHYDKIEGDEEAKEASKEKYTLCIECDDCYSRDSCPKFVKNNPLK